MAGIMLFSLGSTRSTPAALAAILDSGQSPSGFLDLHRMAYWGDLEPEDRAANDAALRDGGRLLSKYHTAKGVALYVITEADRSATTILLPKEY